MECKSIIHSHHAIFFILNFTVRADNLIFSSRYFSIKSLSFIELNTYVRFRENF